MGSIITNILGIAMGILGLVALLAAVVAVWRWDPESSPRWLRVLAWMVCLAFMSLGTLINGGTSSRSRPPDRDIGMGRRMAAGLGAHSWATTQGVVLPGGEFRYAYAWDGKEYIGTKIDASDLAGARTSDEARELHDQYRSRYAPGVVIAVYVSPADPAVALVSAARPTRLERFSAYWGHAFPGKAVLVVVLFVTSWFLPAMYNDGTLSMSRERAAQVQMALLAAALLIALL
jgi:hypothetical protein